MGQGGAGSCSMDSASSSQLSSSPVSATAAGEALKEGCTDHHCCHSTGAEEITRIIDWITSKLKAMAMQPRWSHPGSPEGWKRSQAWQEGSYAKLKLTFGFTLLAFLALTGSDGFQLKI